MSGNLIDRQVNLYKQNVAFKQNGQQNPNTQYYKTAPQQADSFTEQDAPKKEPNTLACILASWLGINWLSDGFEKNCGKADYDKTIMGRMGNLGDKISQKTANNSAVNSVKGFFGKIKTNVGNFIEKSPLLNGIFATPTKPEASQAISIMETQYEADLKEAVNVMDKYITGTPKSFKEINATKAEIEALKAKYGTGMFGKIKNLDKALLELQFDRLGAPAGYIDTLAPENIAEELKNFKLKGLGFADKDAFKTIKDSVEKEPQKYATEILEACKKGGKNAKAIFSRMPLMNRSKDLLSSTNKLMAETKHASKLGKFMAKMPKLLMRGLTFGGGRINTILVALGLGMAAKNTIIAPKEKKVSTAVGGGMDAMSWIVSMPLAIKAMFGLNGMKYAGMGATKAEQKAAVQTYRDALKAFNADQAAGLLTNKTTYLRRLSQLNKLKEAKIPLNKFQSFMKKFSDKFLAVGLEVPRPYQAPTEGLTGAALKKVKAGNWKRMAGFLSKNYIAYPLRFAAYMLIFQPIVDKIITTCTNAIFGKPYEPPEEGVNEGVNSEENIANIPVNTDNSTQSTNVEQSQQSHKKLNINELPNDNLIKRTIHGEDIMYSPYLPSEECGLANTESPYDTEPRSYIPSEECLISPEDDEAKAVLQALQKKYGHKFH